MFNAVVCLFFRSPSILTASPDDIPPVDPRALLEVESHARRVAASVDFMLGTLQNNLSKARRPSLAPLLVPSPFVKSLSHFTSAIFIAVNIFCLVFMAPVYEVVLRDLQFSAGISTRFPGLCLCFCVTRDTVADVGAVVPLRRDVQGGRGAHVRRSRCQHQGDRNSQTDLESFPL